MSIYEKYWLNGTFWITVLIALLDMMQCVLTYLRKEQDESKVVHVTKHGMGSGRFHQALVLSSAQHVLQWQADKASTALRLQELLEAKVGKRPRGREVVPCNILDVVSKKTDLQRAMRKQYSNARKLN